jgi:hypothetical protein
LACSPSAALEPPPMPLRVTGGQDSFVRRIYAPGDLITINAGKNNGIEVGQEYYARRLQVDRRTAISRDTPATIRTTGWIKVYAVDDEMSLATISHACDTIEIGDYLEPFKLPVVPTISKDRPKPQRDHYGKVQVGTDRRTSFGKGDYFVINRGSDHGVEVGSQFVLYRDKKQAENLPVSDRRGRRHRGEGRAVNGAGDGVARRDRVRRLRRASTRAGSEVGRRSNPRAAGVRC